MLVTYLEVTAYTGRWFCACSGTSFRKFSVHPENCHSSPLSEPDVNRKDSSKY